MYIKSFVVTISWMINMLVVLKYCLIIIHHHFTIINSIS